MRLASKIKKISAVALLGAILFVSAGTISVHAQTIDQVSVNKPGYGIVTTNDGSGVNVRNAPDLNAGIIVSIPNGSPLMIIGQSGDFYYVQYDARGHYGYVYKPYLEFKPHAFYLVADTASGSLNMRVEPSQTSSIIASIPHGAAFAYYGLSEDEWYYGLYGNVVGYTSKDYTSLELY